MARRFFVVLAAVVLGVSVLVVAGSPVGAANTASESLYDHDGDTATSSVRRFGGANRYATSVALAEAYVESVGSGGFVDSVIVASGASVIDAAAAAGLAAIKSAPVLLTTPNRLSRLVENFIVDEFITDVFIVGGLEAVSQDVEDALADLATVRTVKRLSGADRYATSVALAEEMGTPGVYCQSGLVTALLVNVDSSFADVIALGPLAYALELPVLLTRADELPTVVAAYLTDAEVERVVIIGGETAVSASVAADLSLAGVTDVARVSGENRFATALAIRDELADCQTIALSPSAVALVNADAAADGVSAGPLLGTGVDVTGVTPVLLVQAGQLPSETSDYLASIPVRTNTATFVDLDLTAIGGTAVVSASVMQAAVNAATTSEPLTATVKATAGASSFTITFSGNVNLADAENRANYRVGGAPLLASDELELAARKLTVDLGGNTSDQFVAGMTISVLGGKIRGDGGDKRRVVAATYTVPRTVPDNVRPNVRIVAPANANIIRIVITEASLATTTSTFVVTNIERNGAALTTAAVKPGGTNKDLVICLFGLVDGEEVEGVVMPGDTCVADGSTLEPAQTPLAAGERVTLAAGAFSDTSGNNSRTTSVRVASFDTLPRVTRATVSRPATLVEGTVPQLAKWEWIRHTDTVNTGTPDNDLATDGERNLLTITAKADGPAGGAAGNAWYVDWFMSSDDDDAPEVSVNLFEYRKTIQIGFDDEATLHTVVTALLDNKEVGELFNIASAALENTELATLSLQLAASPERCEATNPPEVASDGEYVDCGGPDSSRRQLTGGRSFVTVTLTYNGIVQFFNYETVQNENPGGGFGNSWDDAPSATPDNKVSFRISTNDPTPSALPKSGGTINLPADLAYSYAKSGAGACTSAATCQSSEKVDNYRLRAG